MWDLLILTAGSESQKCDFEKQMEYIKWYEYAKEMRIISDYPEGVKTGSGGSTMEVLHQISIDNKLSRLRGKSKCLLFHSGGLSQRMPHLSSFGKIFTHLTDGRTILEVKLDSYKTLSRSLPNGLLVSACDVIEDVKEYKKTDNDTEIILFAHESSVKIAKQHGVYTVDDTGSLLSVLQKPTEDEMKRERAIRKDNTVLTDSFYFLSWSICDKLLAVYQQKRPISVELCCYSDYLRPLGTQPILDYIEKSTGRLQEWRSILADIFKNCSVNVVNLGADTFFHFGTFEEFLEHASNESIFAKRFHMKHREKTVNLQIPHNSFVEYSHLNGRIGDNSIVSNCSFGEAIDLPNDILIFTTKMEKGYVTVLLSIDADIKKEEITVFWMGKNTNIKGKSLWNAALFPIAQTMENSFRITLKMLEEKFHFDNQMERLSIEEIIRKKDIGAMLDYRKQFGKEM